MSETRRYDDDEVQRIFQLATEAGHQPEGPGTPGSGLTLTQIREIGAEAGIAPERIARAAASLDTPAPPTPVRTLGVAVSVAHTVDLPAPLSDPEWDRLVVYLRETFAARGRVSREGSLRSWVNGNLQVLHEPTGTGARLRMRTVSASIRQRVGSGLALMGASGAGAAILTLGGSLETGAVAGLGMIAALGGGMLASAIRRSPRWREERWGQFLDVGRQARAIIEERSTPHLPPDGADPGS